jgi:dephospho-CoA kinase
MIIGLTGGSGSGKSVVARIFSLLGCAVFNSDEQARNVYHEVAVKARIVELLGAGAYNADSSLNKNYIRDRIFSDPEMMRSVNSVVHPAVGKSFADFIVKNKNRIIVKESALLFEAGVEKQVDVVVVITANESTRLQRIMDRDKITESAARQRLASQWPDEKKVGGAQYVIKNDGTELVIPQVLNVLEQIRGK